ncbi:MAG: DUF4249 family protein, partial [Chitinophagaceae bacterium]|nr:DUF4249 family protein [Chitinophagaceae bacterium]
MKRNVPIVMAILLFSCEKTVDFKLNEQPDKLVVEATIENSQPPRVFLSNSLNFFSKISPDVLAQSFVHNADVFVSNGVLTHKLKEYSLQIAPGYFLYYYSIDSSNISTAFLGELNTKYSLRIVSNGKEYFAVTTIPNVTRRIDSLWWKPAPNTSDTTKVVVMIRATDRPGFGDYVRYFTKKNSEPFLPGFTSAFDDLVIDGIT